MSNVPTRRPSGRSKAVAPGTIAVGCRPRYRVVRRSDSATASFVTSLDTESERHFHSGLVVPHYDDPTSLELGRHDVPPSNRCSRSVTIDYDIWDDSWTVVTRDGKRTCPVRAHDPCHRDWFGDPHAPRRSACVSPTCALGSVEPFKFQQGAHHGCWIRNRHPLARRCQDAID